MINIDSRYLLSLDFRHDNKNKNRFFKKYKMYDLNKIDKVNNIDKILFRIKKFKFKESYEDHVKKIMLNNFKHTHYNYIYNYNTIDKNIDIILQDEYTIICDNMQCTMNNIHNIRILLKNLRIKIYIPFILCCENLSKDNDNKILKSYNNIVNNLKINPLYDENYYEIKPCDFFDNSGNLLDEYIYESNIIGYDIINGKLLNYNDVDDTSKINNIINDFKNYENSLYFIDTQSEKENNTDNKLLKTIVTNIIKKINNKNELDEVDINNFRALIYSMKEMRDWFERENMNLF